MGSTIKAYALTVTATLQNSGLASDDPRLHSFSGTVQIRNATSSEVQMVLAAYRLSGFRAVEAPGTQSDFRRRLALSEESGLGGTGRYVDYGSNELLEVGELYSGTSMLEPSQESSFRIYFAVPERQLQRYSGLTLSLSLLLSKGERMSLSQPVQMIKAPCLYPSLTDLCSITVWRIVTPGWMWRITRGEQTLAVWQDIAPTTSTPSLWTGQCVADAGAQPRGDHDVCPRDRVHRGLAEYYGLGQVQTSSDFALAGSST